MCWVHRLSEPQVLKRRARSWRLYVRLKCGNGKTEVPLTRQGFTWAEVMVVGLLCMVTWNRLQQSQICQTWFSYSMIYGMGFYKCVDMGRGLSPLWCVSVCIPYICQRWLNVLSRIYTLYPIRKGAHRIAMDRNRCKIGVGNALWRIQMYNLRRLANWLAYWNVLLCKNKCVGEFLTC